MLPPTAFLGPLAAASRVVFGLPTPLVRLLAAPDRVREGRTLDPEMALVLRTQRLRGRAVEDLPIAAGRVRIDADGAIVGGRQPIGSVTERVVDGPGGDLRVRLYHPRDLDGPAPGLLYLHGGGWVYGSLDSHDATCRFLAERAGVRVVAVDYRLAPEHPFPAAVEDAWAAWTWLVRHAPEHGIDPARIAVGGDSAGGNLATVVAQRAVREGGPVPALQVLVYPAVDFVDRRPSRDVHAQGSWLTSRFVDLAERCYLPDGQDRTDWRLSPIHGDLEGLPPAHVVTAGFDPLRDEGRDYAEAMRAAGVDVTFRCEETLQHLFANVVGLGRSGPAAMARVAEGLRRALA